MVTTEDIDQAQTELNDAIERAQAAGLTFRTSPEWATALSRVATLRRRKEQQDKLFAQREQDSWHQVPRMHVVK